MKADSIRDWKQEGTTRVVIHPDYSSCRIVTQYYLSCFV
uniref:Uncharacterized protein n=1 Tax=Anguilla anguilla TaxID=7936 RepID=A0A0E9QU99_ANGAN